MKSNDLKPSQKCLAQLKSHPYSASKATEILVQKIGSLIKMVGEIDKATADQSASVLSKYEYHNEYAGSAMGPAPFDDLINILAMYCDDVIKVIDPTPLLRLADFVRSASVHDLISQQRRFNELWQEAANILHRMELRFKAIGVKVPKYKTPPCPECKGKVKVASTQNINRYLVCKECRHHFSEQRY